MQKVEASFKKEAAAAKRSFDAKNTRMDDVHKPNREISEWTRINKVCRRYESVIELNEAQLKSAWTTEKTLRAEIGMHVSHMHVMKLEMARLRRELRRTKK